MRLKYNLIHIIATKPYVQILTLDVNKVPNHAYNLHWNIIYITVTSITSNIFPNASQKGICLHYQKVP